MGRLIEIARSGLLAARLHPLRSGVTASAIVAVLVPFLAGVGISRGLEEQALDAVVEGADLYVSGNRFGRRVPLPEALGGHIASLEGVIRVTPRVLGRIRIGVNDEEAVVLGLPESALPQPSRLVTGRLFEPGPSHELVMGSELASRLRLAVDDRIPPFYRSSQGERVSRLVGVFHSELPMWSARLVLTSLESAQHYFDQPALVSDFAVHCRPGYAAVVARRLSGELGLRDAGQPLRLAVTSREELAALLPGGLLAAEGAFTAQYLPALAVAIMVVMVTSGLGLSERRREIGTLKALGWQTDEVLLRAASESLVLCWVSAGLAVVLAWVWLEAFNGFFIASIFLPGAALRPGFDVPFLLTPLPALLAFLLSGVVVLTGTLYSTWRAASCPPLEAMR